MSHLDEIQWSEIEQNLFNDGNQSLQPSLPARSAYDQYQALSDNAETTEPIDQESSWEATFAMILNMDRATLEAEGLNGRLPNYATLPDASHGPIEILELPPISSNNEFLGPPAAASLDIQCSEIYEPGSLDCFPSVSFPNTQTSPIEAVSTRNEPSQETSDIARREFYCRWEDCPRRLPFQHESSLTRHERIFHTSPQALSCPIEGCRKVCKRKDNLKQHMRNIHGGC